MVVFFYLENCLNFRVSFPFKRIENMESTIFGRIVTHICCKLNYTSTGRFLMPILLCEYAFDS